MQRLRLLLRRLLGSRKGRTPTPNAECAPRPQQVGDYLSLLQQHPGTRITTVRLLGRQTTEDNVLSMREHLETEDDQGNARQVDVYDARTCSFGHLLDQTVRATSLCQICGELMCSSENCTGWCCVCGAACCANHRTTYDLGAGKTATYCSRCRWHHWWRLWWGFYA